MLIFVWSKVIFFLLMYVVFPLLLLLFDRQIDTEYLNKVLKFVLDLLLADEYVSKIIFVFLTESHFENGSSYVKNFLFHCS